MVLPNKPLISRITPLSLIYLSFLHEKQTALVPKSRCFESFRYPPAMPAFPAVAACPTPSSRLLVERPHPLVSAAVGYR